MPEPKVRKSAAEKKKVADTKAKVASRKDKAAKAPGAGNRWVPIVFIVLGLLGVAWIVVFNLAASHIPPMSALGNWNYLIGIGLMAASLIVATQWK
ncbi:cell division protein CrgA [Naumannella halotolerans]|uniref:Cell division protein CrgA n=1 Tax=Naumannella halotolerans TaxID=993414 RepID=A0A4R7J3B4_9ACTN|nr:cell division protein CrgA [Naumannella halotolerans]TDT30833.1 uncharacterized protein UPF0233 [Naumannella halotolerans]